MRKTYSLATAVLLFISFFAGAGAFAQQKNDAALPAIERNKKDNTPILITFSEDANLKLQDAQAIFEKYSGINNPTDKLVLFSHTPTKSETVVDRYLQYYKGIKIEYSSFSVMAKNDRVSFISCNIYNVPEGSSTVPVLTEAGALAKALERIGAQQYKWEDTAAENFLKRSRNNPNLTYYPKGELVWVQDMLMPEEQRSRSLHLAYCFNIYAAQPMSRDKVYVDAITGKILQVSNQIHTASGSGPTLYSGTRTFDVNIYTSLYRLVDQTRSAWVIIYDFNNTTSSGSLATNGSSSSTSWPLDTSSDVHWAQGRVYDYWLATHGRASYDNANADLYGYTHYGSGYNNAFWDGSEMVYGDGSGSATGFDPLVSLDVCAHELGHAVCEYTANLTYASESGAMNEGFSDCWGAIIENYADPLESDAKAKNMWDIGEEIDTSPLREMDNPNSHGQPDTYGGTWWFNVVSCTPSTANDQCGVHTNSGVFNFWFYLLTVGGSGTNDIGNAYSVTGVGTTKAANILYQTELVLSSSADYATMRASSITVATTLYGSCSPEVIAVTKAWYAVGVGSNFTATPATAITGTASVCVGLTTTLNSTPSGGTWTTSSSTVAGVGSTTGIVTGNTAGNAVITYTVSGPCYVTKQVTVNTQPAAISGTQTVCVGGTTTFSSTTSGGTWSSSASGTASVAGSGTTATVTGVAAGTATITYTLSNGCFVIRSVTVNAQPSAITGTQTVCVGLTTAFSSSPTGGTWTSSNTAVGTVSSSGTVGGVSAGNATITYTLTGGCFSTRGVTVNTQPTAITGTASVCVGATTTLNSTPSGGTWTSSNASLATVNSSSGAVTGVAAGNPIITYTLSGGCFTTRTMTVNDQPSAITGTATVCVGLTTTLSSSPSGGTWTSSSGNATVNSTSGVVTGATAGNATISYTLTGGCFVTQQVTVNTQPTAITGTASLCVGATTTLNSTPAGGTWTSSITGQATVGSSTGIVTGIAAGNPVITYVLSNGCFATRIMTVSTQPTAITGTATVCTGLTTTLNSTPSGGTWTSSSSNATVNSTSGVVTGATAGNATISYTLTGGCFVTQQVTVSTQPTSITGTASICVGATTTLNSTPSGGVWSSSNTGQATVGSSSGIVTGVGAGNPLITYILPGGCFTTRIMTINTQPSAITGTFAICTGFTTTLNATPAGGTWSSSNSSIATIGTGTGIASGIAAGTNVMTYTLTGGCFSTHTFTVTANPSAISGTTNVCVGLTTTLNCTPSGGTWASSASGTASVNSTSGVVTGGSAGTATITYTLNTGCFSTQGVTVNAQPAALTGTASVCTGLTTTLNCVTSGGTFTSSNATIATVGSTTGVVTGATAGIATISYTLPTGCLSTQQVTVVSTPSAITGTAIICAGTSTTLSSSPSGGSWTSGATGVATVVPGTGLVSGISAGTADITYSLSVGCFATRTVTVLTSPAAITGTALFCVGTNTTLSSATSGGTWTSSNATVASVGSSSGVVTGNTTGTATITYTISNGCFVIQVVTVVATPSGITGTAGLCIGSSTTLSSSPSGGNWSSGAPAIATVGSTGTVTGASAGNADITYSLGGSCFSTRQVTVHTSVASITGTLTVCVGASTGLSCSTPGGSWISGTTGIATVGAGTGVVTGVSAGTVDITYILGAGCQSVATVTVLVTPSTISGTPVVCVGGATTLNSSPSGGTWTSSAPGIALVSGGVVTGLTAGTTIITYTLSTGCFVTQSVTVNSNPVAITGAANVCVGSTTTLNCTPPGGTWTSDNILFATVHATNGTVTGVGNGTVDITYTLSTGCFSIRNVTVDIAPAPISGASVICTSSSTTFSSSPSGGIWASSAPGVASVGSSSGLVTGAGAGSATITYTLSGGCFATKPVTVSNNPNTISGTLTVCAGSTTALSSSPAGGTWSSSVPGVASVNSTNGVVTGVSAGTANITYTLSGGCFVSATVTVNAAPGSISGASAVCIGSSTIFSSSTSGGIWTSTASGIASVGTTSGVVTGVSSGSATIIYTLIGGCFTTKPITVNALPTITLGTSPVVISGATSANLPYTATGGSPSTYSIIYSTGAITAGFANVSSAVLTSTPIVLVVPGTAPASVYSATLTVSSATCTSINYPFTVTVNSGVNTPPVFTGGSPQSYLACSFPVLNSIDALLQISDPDVGNIETWTVLSTPSHGTIFSGGTQVSTGGTVTPTGFTYRAAYAYLGTDAFTIRVSDGAGGTATTTINVTVNPVPAIVTVTGGGGYCTGGAGVTVGLSGSAMGVNYQLYRNGTPVGSPVAGVGAALSFGLQTVAGIYTVTASNASAPCTQNMAGSVTVTVYSLPNVYTVTGGGAYCPGGAGVLVGLSGSDIGVNYRLYRSGTPVGSPVVGTGTVLNFGLQANTGTYTVVATASPTGCTSNMTGSAVVSLNPTPTAYIVTGGGGYCAGGTGVNIGLSSSDVGVSYQLRKGTVPVGSPVAGTGAALNFGLFTVVGSYTVIATNTTTGCTSNMSGSASVTIMSLPYPFLVNGGGSYCAGGVGVLVGLGGTVFGTSYQLYRSATAVGSPIAGTGAAINFGLQTIAGTYTVVATNTSTGCTNNMLGSATVTIISLPTAYTVTGGGSYCTGTAGLHVGLSSSNIGINYQLYRGAAPVGAFVAGTGGALDFGVFTSAGVYTVLAYVAGTSCGTSMTGSVSISVNPLPTAYTVSGGGAYCSGGSGNHIYLSSSSVGVNYQLYLGGVTAVGSPVAGTGTTIDFGLFTIAGPYTVVATNSTTGCVNIMTGSATITITAPPVAFTVTGGGSYCVGGAGLAVGLSGSQVGVSYQLYVGATPAGSPMVGTGAALNFGIQSAGGTYTVVGSTSGSCSANMTGSVTITVNTLPNAYIVTGGGAYCASGSGVPVGLSGSDAGVNYQLYRGTAAIGSPVAGTGTSLSFGLQVITGTYTVVATNATTGCVRNMSGSATVTISSAPAVIAMTGGDAYCSGGSGVLMGLAGSAIGVNYQLYRGATAVGSPIAGTGAALSFGLQTVAGTYTAVGTFASSSCSSNMSGSVTVTVLSLPNIYTVTGGGAYCAGGSGAVVGLSSSDIGVSYKLFRGGTPVTLMSGTGTALNFGLMTAAGTYTVVATTGSGCSATMSGSVTVTINPVPTISGSIYTVMPSASITLTATPSGGSWSSSNTAVGTVSSTGVVTGISLGTAVITYTLSTGCYDVQIINVTPTGFRGVNGNTVTATPVSLLEIMPNPNRGIFTMKGSVGDEDAELLLNVVDMLGRVVYAAAVTATNGNVDRVIELGNVASGRYLLRVQTPTENLVYHIIVEQ